MTLWVLVPWPSRGTMPFMLRAFALLLLTTGCLSFGSSRVCFDDIYGLKHLVGSSARGGATCSRGKSRGYCVSHTPMMRKFCDKTCYQCQSITKLPTVHPTPKPHCSDDEKGLIQLMGSGVKCYHGKIHGYCGSHKHLMRHFCAKTCGLCAGGSNSNACAASPCLNGGTCALPSGSGHRLLRSMSFLCRYSAGYAGARCESSSHHSCKGKLTAGIYHTCAVLNSGVAKCWGSNYRGELGDGSTADRHTPVSVSGLAGVVQIAAGQHHTCAVLKTGATKCWGRNRHGQLGDGTTTSDSPRSHGGGTGARAGSYSTRARCYARAQRSAGETIITASLATAPVATVTATMIATLQWLSMVSRGWYRSRWESCTCVQ